MREDMAGGMTTQEAADKYEFPYFTVYSIRRGWTYMEAGGPIEKRKRGRMTPEKAEKVRALKAKGATIAQLAKAAKCGKTTIKKALAGDI